MDLYKFTTLVIFMNITLSLVSATTKEGDTWENFVGAQTLTTLEEQQNQSTDTLTDREGLASQQADNVIEDTGGLSSVKLRWNFFTIASNILFGSLKAVGGYAIRNTNDDITLQMVAWGVGIFLVLLHVNLGLKWYAWFINKDTR